MNCNSFLIFLYRCNFVKLRLSCRKRCPGYRCFTIVRVFSFGNVYLKYLACQNSLWVAIHQRYRAALVCMAALGFVVVSGFSPVQAATPPPGCDSAQAGCVAVGEWDISIGVGVGLRSNPLIDGSDLPLFILPEIRYYGERFFFDTYTGGFTFFDSEYHQLNLVGTIGFDQIYFSSRNIGNFVIESGPISGSSSNALEDLDYRLDTDDVNNPENLTASEIEAAIDIDDLHKRSTAGLVGFEYGYFKNSWDASIQLLQDVSSVHDGQEIRAAVSRNFIVVNEALEFSAGFSWQSDQLLQYYYGVEEHEVDSPELAYHMDAGYSPFVKVDWRRRLWGNWSWQATIHHRWLSSEITRSPLLDESTVLTAYIGGVYHF